MTKARILANTVSTGNVLADGTINTTEIGLGNVENKSSATIRSELTSANVTTALGGVINNIEIGNITPNAGTFTSVTVPVASGNAVISSNTSIASWLYSGKSFFIGTQESAPTGLFIGSAGTKMYVNGSTGDDVNEYTLGTAWNITTATFVTVFSTAAQDTIPVDLVFSPDGFTMMIMGGTTDTVYQYTLSTAWSVATASYSNKSFNVGTQEASPSGLWFKPDGTVMYVVGSVTDAVYQYSLSTAWDVSTASYGGIFYNVAAQDTAPTQVNLSNDGLKMWLLGSAGDDIWEYNLGTAWNISTATPANNVYIGFQDVTPNGLFIDSTASNRVYMVGSTTDSVFQYNTAINSAQFSTDKLYTPGALSVNGNFVAGENAYVDGTLTVQGAATLGTTTLGSITITGSINANTNTNNYTLGTAQTTGTWAAGGTSQTGAITLGQSTVSQTTNIQAGATASGSTKTINFGTGGLTGSTTTIAIGSTFGTAVTANGTWTYSTPIIGSITGSAATLTTPRTLALTGDVAYTSGSFNGSADVTGVATLASVGTAGTYTKVTTDSKGRVTSGATLVAGDIPSLDASKITSGVIDAARLPSYVDDVVEAANLAGFPATGETGKIYVALDTNKVYRWSGSAYIYITSGAVDSVAGRTGVVTLTSNDVGLGSVENKSSATIRGEISSANVTTALGFTPYNATNPNGYITSAGNATNVTGTVAVANGGTGRTTLTNNSLLVGNATGQVAFLAPSTAGNVLMSTGTVWQSTTRQDVMDSLAGAVTAGQYLRGNGTDVVMSAIQAADVPTLNQNTTGTSSNITAFTINQNLGTANNATFAGLNLTGSTLQLGGVTALNRGATWSEFMDPSGSTKFWAGNNASIYMNASDYYLRSNDSSATWVNINSSLLSHSSSLRAPIFYDTSDTFYNIDPSSTSSFNVIRSYALAYQGSVSSDNTWGMYFDSGLSSGYGVYRGSGAWNHPYPDLRIAFHTGIQLGANPGYGGTRFYNETDMATEIFSVGNTDNNVRVGYTLFSPNLYDSNNTAFYVDPASTTNLNVLFVGGQQVTGGASGMSSAKGYFFSGF